ncbi:hypothetical protein BGX27_009471 [Mortierella sp. AM989]|nr:hypothetical protein BGX27_009471 [Mortierella sp. AM989]
MPDGTADLFDSIIPDGALSEVNGDGSDDGLPILGTNHDSASDSEADDHDGETGDYLSDVSDSEPETEDDIVYSDASDPPTVGPKILSPILCCTVFCLFLKTGPTWANSSISTLHVPS